MPSYLPMFSIFNIEIWPSLISFSSRATSNFMLSFWQMELNMKFKDLVVLSLYLSFNCCEFPTSNLLFIGYRRSRIIKNWTNEKIYLWFRREVCHKLISLSGICVCSDLYFFGFLLSFIHYSFSWSGSGSSMPEFPSQLDWLNAAPLQFQRVVLIAYCCFS